MNREPERQWQEDDVAPSYEDEDEAPICCLCGGPCEPWHEEPTGYGNNPAPLGVEGDRCCHACNDTYDIDYLVDAILAQFRENR